MVSRSQPSTSTNRISLNGSEMSTGGNTMMPIEIRVVATTMSMMTNGMKMSTPILNATASSWRMNAGMRM